MKASHHLLLSALFATLLVACGSGTSESTSESETTSPKVVNSSVQLRPGDFVAERPASSFSYMDSLVKCGVAEIWFEENDESFPEIIWKTLQELDDYRAGKSRYYPAEHVRRCLDNMAFAIGRAEGHGNLMIGEEPDDTISAKSEVFFFRFLEQAAICCPTIDFITDFHSNDGQAGVLYYSSWSPLPLYSFLIYKTPDGCTVQTLGTIGDTRITKIFKLGDDKGRTYYLCSNNAFEEENYDDGYECNALFVQILFQFEDYKMRKVGEYRRSFNLLDESPKVEMVYGKTFIKFNPGKLSWNYCTRKGDIYHAIPQTPTLRLTLDGDNSRFETDNGELF